MLAGGEVALLDGALVGETLGALQKELGAFATAKAADWLRYNVPFLLLTSDDDRFTRWQRFVPIHGLSLVLAGQLREAGMLSSLNR